MRKLALLAAVVAMVGAVSADAANVTFGIQQAGGGSGTITVTPSTVVQIEITANVDSAANLSEGLALWGSDLVFSGAGLRANLTGAGDLLNDPANVDPIQQFDYPNGVTNPPHVADASGYRGTGSGATNLLQAGGGMNTIGNPSSGGAPFPIGSVITNVAQNATVVVATGSYDVGATTGVTHTITLANCFANTIDDLEAGPTVYNVSAATTACGAALNIFVGGGGGPVTSAVSRRGAPTNCDITMNLAGRTVDPRSPGVSQVVINYGAAPGATPVTLAWVNPVQACGGGEGTYSAYSGASAMNCVTNPLDITCTFTPALENVRAYRLTVPDGGATRDIKFRALIGDSAPNPGDGNGIVDSADRSAVVAQWTAPGFSCATDARTDIGVSGVTDSADRSSVVGAWTNPNARCVP